MIDLARGFGSMFSIIIPTHDSERALVPTLAALVPGATAGIVREVIVTDGGSRDQTEQVADIAGCRFLAPRRRAEGLKAAADAARGDWLMFLRARPGAGRDLDRRDDRVHEMRPARRRAPPYSPREGGCAASARSHLLAPARRRAGLIIRKCSTEKHGGHRESAADPETRPAAPHRAAPPRHAARHGHDSRIFDSVNQLLDTVTDPANRQVTDDAANDSNSASRRCGASPASTRAQIGAAARKPGAHALLAHRGARALRTRASRARRRRARSPPISTSTTAISAASCAASARRA